MFRDNKYVHVYTSLYCHDSHTMWKCCTHYCTVTTYTLCGNVVHIIVLSRLTRYVELLYTLLYCHDSHAMCNCCTHYCSVTIHTGCETFAHNNLLSQSAKKVNSLCTILYCHESNTLWNLCAEHCTVTTNTRCETFVQNIVLSRLTHALSEWLLLNAKSAIFHLYYDQNKLIFNDMMMRSVLF